MRIFAASLLALTLATSAHAIPVYMEDTEVRDFVRWYADQRDLSIAIDPRVEGRLTVFADDVPEHELTDFVHGVLSAHGYEILYGNPTVLVPIQDQPRDFTDEIDVPEPPQATQLLALENVRADDLAPLVTNFLTRSSRGSTQPAHAEVLHAANALLVSGPQERLDALQRLLPDFDVAHPQVMIQAVIFELTDGDSLDLGVALGSASGSSVAGGFNTRNLGDELSLSGGSFGIFDGGTLALAVNAIQRTSNARVLSTPQILALSGRTGRISVGQNVPIITGRVTGEAADVDSPFQTLERRDVGVTLNVTPVVTASGLIVMDVRTTADSLTDSMAAADIITNQRSIATTVQIDSGQTLLLGGLVSEDVQESVSAVPVLGDIPVLGRLFRSTSTSTEQRQLFVLLQATEVARHGV
ncbi:MAG: secretin N-terminal domain-containing protein [Pseudomonadota bacterium]